MKTNEQKLFKLPSIKEDQFIKDFNKVNRALDKYGAQMVVTNRQEYTEFIAVEEGSDLWMGVVPLVEISSLNKGFYVPAVAYTIELPLKRGKEDVEFLGLVKYEEGVPTIVYSSSNSELNLRDLLEEKKDLCDHCGVKRHRRKYFYFLENGKVQAIGSTCVREWFGLNLEWIFRKFESFFYDYSIMDIPSNRAREVALVDLSHVVAAVSVVTDEFKLPWKSQSYAEENSVLRTTIEVSELLVRPQKAEIVTQKKYEALLSEKEKLNGLLSTIEEFWKNRNISSDFEFNMSVQLLRKDKTIFSKVPFSKLGLVSYGIYRAFQEEKKKKEEPTFSHKNLELGSIKERIQIQGTLRKVHSYWTPSYSGYGEDIMYIYTVETEDGLAKWVTGKDLIDDLKDILEKEVWDDYSQVVTRIHEGLPATIVGTVKKIETYRGEIQTVLTRCRVEFHK